MERVLRLTEYVDVVFTCKNWDKNGEVGLLVEYLVSNVRRPVVKVLTLFSNVLLDCLFAMATKSTIALLLFIHEQCNVLGLLFGRFICFVVFIRRGGFVFFRYIIFHLLTLTTGLVLNLNMSDQT